MKEFTVALGELTNPPPVKRVKERMPPCWFCGSARSKRSVTITGEVECLNERGCWARAFKNDTAK